MNVAQLLDCSALQKRLFHWVSMELMAMTEASMAMTVTNRTRTAQRSSEKKYGRASRQMMADVARRRDTGLLLSAGSGSKLRLGDGSADQFGLNWAIVPFHGWEPWV